MIKHLFAFALTFLYLQSAAAEDSRFAADNADLALSAKLLQQTFAQHKDSFVLSPLSVYEASALLANGAAGKSLEEIQTNILGSEDLPKINDTLNIYRRNLSKAVEINDSVWGDDMLSEYLKTATEKLHAEVMPLPKNTSAINQWISRKTAGRITDVIPQEQPDEGDVYLVNTVYFRDDWKNDFKIENTEMADFYSLGAAEPDKVNMMHEWRHEDYFENDIMQALRLKYKNGDVIQIFLPKKEIDFAEFVQNLKPEDLKVEYKNREVKIYLPRFEIDYKIANMKDMFKKLGVEQVFNNCYGIGCADLSKLSNTPKYVRKIIHQSKIRVDEQGTVAVGAVIDEAGNVIGFGGFGGPSAPPPPPPVFRADHPFLFMLNDGLFIGTYTKGSLVKEGFIPDSCYKDGFDYACLLRKAENSKLTSLVNCLRTNGPNSPYSEFCMEFKDIAEENLVHNSKGQIVGYIDEIKYTYDRKKHQEIRTPYENGIKDIYRISKRWGSAERELAGKIYNNKIIGCAHFDAEGKVIAEDDPNCEMPDCDLLKCYRDDTHYDYDCLLQQAREKQNVVYESCLMKNRKWYEDWREAVKPNSASTFGAGLVQCLSDVISGDREVEEHFVYDHDGHVVGYYFYDDTVNLFGKTLYKTGGLVIYNSYNYREYIYHDFRVLFGKVLSRYVHFDADGRMIYDIPIFPAFEQNANTDKTNLARQTNREDNNVSNVPNYADIPDLCHKYISGYQVIGYDDYPK